MSLCYHPHCPINGKSKTCSQKVHNFNIWVSPETGTPFCKSKGIKSRDCFADNGGAVSIYSKEILSLQIKSQEKNEENVMPMQIENKVRKEGHRSTLA